MTERLATWRRATDWPLMALAVGSLPVLLLEIDRTSLPTSDQVFIDVVNLTVLAAFLVDYVVELVFARQRARYVRNEWMSLIIVAAQAVSLLPALAALGVLRALRAARLFRLLAVVLRGVAIGGAVKVSGRQLVREHTVALAFGTAGLTWITSAAAFTIAEGVGVGQQYDSFGDALWWSLATITTVGYGDVAPVTPAGRVIGGFTMIVGISTFALVTAKIAQFLVRPEATAPSPGESGDSSEPDALRSGHLERSSARSLMGRWSRT
jgi:voltage-gated potassium channel